MLIKFQSRTIEDSIFYHTNRNLRNVFSSFFFEDLMLPGVILPSDGLSGLGRFENGTLCCVCLKGNRLVRGRYRIQS